jgi:hypothetical protein
MMQLARILIILTLFFTGVTSVKAQDAKSEWWSDPKQQVLGAGDAAGIGGGTTPVGTDSALPRSGSGDLSMMILAAGVLMTGSGIFALNYGKSSGR